MKAKDKATTYSNQFATCMLICRLHQGWDECLELAIAKLHSSIVKTDPEDKDESVCSRQRIEPGHG